MKKFLVTLIALTMSLPVSAMAATNVTAKYNPATSVVVEGDTLYMPNLDYNGTIYVPLNALSDNLNITTNWNPTTSTITINSKTPAGSNEKALSQLKPLVNDLYDYTTLETNGNYLYLAIDVTHNFYYKYMQGYIDDLGGEMNTLNQQLYDVRDAIYKLKNIEFNDQKKSYVAYNYILLVDKVNDGFTEFVLSDMTYEDAKKQLDITYECLYNMQELLNTDVEDELYQKVEDIYAVLNQ